MNRTLVFDMDGTLVDLYGVEGWLEALRNGDPTPYKTAKPLYDMDKLRDLLLLFKDLGWEIVVTTWLAKGSDKFYDALVREAKIAWLNHFNFPYDEIHLVKYGTTKANCTRAKGGFQVLVDDNDKILSGWTLGDTINAKENIFDRLNELLQCICFERKRRGYYKK